MRQDTHDELTPAAEDGIASYLLGLSSVDIELFEEHLTTCKICRQEVTRLKPIIAELVFSADRAEPPPGLRERVLALTTQEPSSPEGFEVPPSADLKWIPSGVPGVEISQLSTDPKRERHTTLIRVAAGASIPAHRHGGLEECIVLQGDVRDGQRKLVGGDHVRYAAGSEHELHSVGGCLLLVNASFHDERLVSHD